MERLQPFATSGGAECFYGRVTLFGIAGLAGEYEILDRFWGFAILPFDMIDGRIFFGQLGWAIEALATVNMDSLLEAVSSAPGSSGRASYPVEWRAILFAVKPGEHKGTVRHRIEARTGAVFRSLGDLP